MKQIKAVLKRIISLTVCAVLIFGLCSCNSKGRYQKRDLDERIIVHAIGLDKTKNGKFEVTMQILAQQGAGSLTPIDPSQSNSATVSQISDTIPSAIERCETDLGKKVFLGHSELVLLGESIDDLRPIMEFLINSRGISLGVIMAYTDVTAKEILDIKVTSGTYSAEILKEVFEESEKNGTSTECELIKHIDNMENTKGTTVLPIIKKIKNNKKTSIQKESNNADKGENFGDSDSGSDDKTKAGNEKLKDESSSDSESESSSQSEGGDSGGGKDSQQSEVNAFYIDGAVIVKNRKPKGVMTRDEVIGLSFLNNGIAEQTINAKLNDNMTAVCAGSVKKDTNVGIDDNKISIDVKLTISYEFYKTLSAEDKKEAAKKATEHIYSLCGKTVNKVLKKENADLFEIHSLLNHNDYNLYRAYKENSEEIMKKVDISVNINPQI